jgi:hypothetical protein
VLRLGVSWPGIQVRQHTSAYVSIRQHTSAYFSIAVFRYFYIICVLVLLCVLILLDAFFFFGSLRSLGLVLFSGSKDHLLCQVLVLYMCPRTSRLLLYMCPRTSRLLVLLDAGGWRLLTYADVADVC